MKKLRSSDYIKFKYAKGNTNIYGRMFHDHYEIYLLLAGKVEFTNNHTKQILNPFQLVVIPPGEYHQFVVNGNIDDYERCVIDIYPEIFEPDILPTALSGKELLFLNESNRIVKHFIYLIECLSIMDESDFSHVLCAVATDIIFLIKNYHDVQCVLAENISSLSLNLMSYLNEHFTEQIDLDMLSQKFFCSTSSLCHVFKNDFGISIKKYIIQKRVNVANIALQKGEKPEEVCVKYGFSNYSTFYRDYKKYFGFSPSETYIRKNGAAVNPI